ncbi:hypothetical protein BU26DRAFT_191179 [Trematosphaeria pertusa]|uniref:Uncharacterized protein n=1 Tax=Trematosphaeria pertusa TaxID=390896 RepID=A0A6A6HTF6_9PLEO|nr:uncharacterized protein BU26DRAFT_191179 [Trematosphaeria pertusa]KAF2240813.1 hypothetical protein BU26DRAFT_191179 [Trematosphaeria pertusa]
MPRKEDDSYLPSYSESILQQTANLPTIPSTSRGQQILDQLTLVRAQHIRSIINAHILPLVEQQAAYGIAQTTIALLPSDIPLPEEAPEKSEFSFDTPTSSEKTVEVIGFSSDEEPKVVRLEGQMNRTEFWRPQAIILELERTLRECLNASPRLRSPTSPVFVGRAQREEVPQRQKRGFFGRVANAMAQDEGSPDGSLEVGVSQVESVGQVLVKCRLEEICLRTVNEFGLYDTMSKQCVIIRVDARC